MAAEFLDFRRSQTAATASAAKCVMLFASSIPCRPVQALAFPEFTTMAWADFRAARFALIFTGAAQTWLLVNIPATVAGTSETIRARSRFFPLSDPLPVPSFLMSQKTAAVLKPSGAQMDPGIFLTTLD